MFNVDSIVRRQNCFRILLYFVRFLHNEYQIRRRLAYLFGVNFDAFHVIGTVVVLLLCINYIMVAWLFQLKSWEFLMNGECSYHSTPLPFNL